MAPLRLQIEGRTFRDRKNREITLRGINCASDAKFPSFPDVPSYVPDNFFDGDNCSFVGRPFSIEDASVHFKRIKSYGYNTIRYIFTWEAIEHSGPGVYDEAFIEHTIKVLRLAKTFGFYIFMDPHQDVWSRFTGGSGAPMWTLYAVGLDPHKFAPTEASLVQNTWPEPENYPTMVWATNYWRMSCQLLFTIFFAGRDFAPKAVIDGKNIQDWLQDYFTSACVHLAKRIQEAGDLENDVIIGWETMNEPNRGIIGHQDLAVVDPGQNLKKTTAPTPWQAILLASGRPCEVETWDIGSFGPYKTGSRLVDPRGESAWLPSDHDDSKYGWSRDPGWKLGECLWAQHGVWDPTSDALLRADYFANEPTNGKKIDVEYFTNHHFMDFVRRYFEAIKAVHREAIIFIQPPVMEIPPDLKSTVDDRNDIVYAPHFYDGLTLLTKKWNRIFNVDVLGVLRGRYYLPAFAVKFGETAIRNCLRDQLAAMRQEGLDHMGNHPCLFSEIGIPFDMSDKYAYKTGDYTSQCLAMDANHFALEGAGIAGYTIWTYCATNIHDWGDRWNGEDLSLYSVDDEPLPLTPSNPSQASHLTIDAKPHPQAADSQEAILPSNLRSTLSTPSISRSPSLVSGGDLASKPGHRAAEAYIRPSPIFTCGTISSSGFDLRNAIFSMMLTSKTAPSEDAPTEIFLPEYHFPREHTKVEASSGKWSIAPDKEDRRVQIMKWWHETGEQKVTVHGVKHKLGVAATGSGGTEDEEGYYEQCQNQTNCTIM